MSVRPEVLKANEAYAASFGDEANLALPPARRSPFSPAWTRGSIPPSLLVLPRAMRIYNNPQCGGPSE